MPPQPASREFAVSLATAGPRATIQTMPCLHAPALRSFFVVCLLAQGGALKAAFELTGELPAVYAAASAAVERESLEERSATRVASAPVVSGRLHLRVDAEPGLFTLIIGDARVPFVAADGQSLRVSTAQDGETLRVDGAPDQALFAAYEAFRTESLGRLVLPVREAISNARTRAEIERLTEDEVAAYTRHRRELNDFTLENLGGSPALYAASLRWDGDYRLDDLAVVVRDFSDRHPAIAISQLMEKRISGFRATAIGALAPELSGPTPEGGTISLADLRGKHVLVDFWASWCPPCRMENRHYTELYRRYKDAGFEILAVSVDHIEQAWKAAIAQDRATWLHLSDLGGWRTPLAAKFNVTALPASFLLDPEGRIIAKDARGERLAALLAQHLRPASHR